MITKLTVSDRRFPLEDGAGADSIHTQPVYAYAVCELHTDAGATGIGLAFTLGRGNDLVCQAITALAEPLVGRDIDAVMSDFGNVFRSIADNQHYRWLGPHKGVVHLALAAISNACFDLWAKHRGVPLWKLLLDLSPQAMLATLDLSNLEAVLSADEALALIKAELPNRSLRLSVLESGYPGYDTSVGWFNYDDETIKGNAKRAIEQGFDAMKLKVGSRDIERDIRRAYLIRETVGADARIMLDVNQQWSLPTALQMCQKLEAMRPFWIEEPLHPDDILGHQTLARAIYPIQVALGEHVANRIQFKNFMQAGAAAFIQVDCTRVGGVSEFLTVSLLAKKFGLKVVPHVGDMGQIHQHLVLVNHIAFGLEKIFLEYIPHLREHFIHPAKVESGVYHTPHEPGSSSDLN
ncbi:L-fuconate dehydratase (EC [Olavius sp. associated proteobacterium Delta 1]|nr:L-fuconate dehydratase (EC [Olavius sp. associated proteobacterium Delta 1]